MNNRWQRETKYAISKETKKMWSTMQKFAIIIHGKEFGSPCSVMYHRHFLKESVVNMRIKLYHKYAIIYNKQRSKEDGILYVTEFG